MSDWMKLVQPFNLIGLLNPITGNQWRNQVTDDPQGAQAGGFWRTC